MEPCPNLRLDSCHFHIVHLVTSLIDNQTYIDCYNRVVSFKPGLPTTLFIFSSHEHFVFSEKCSMSYCDQSIRGITVFKIFICGGVSSYIWLEI